MSGKFFSSSKHGRKIAELQWRRSEAAVYKKGVLKNFGFCETCILLYETILVSYNQLFYFAILNIQIIFLHRTRHAYLARFYYYANHFWSTIKHFAYFTKHSVNFANNYLWFEQTPEVVVRRCSTKKQFLKFSKIHRRSHVLESFLGILKATSGKLLLKPLQPYNEYL